ncbi:uncharacterized protein [Littorina saxatilis]|uniref:uncharacterized protein n=1 Tax=Littorina saxatilis TaxID=31220 RepID=UPI0038B61410
MSRGSEMATEICYDWMIEFVCHDIWRKFTSGCVKDDGSEDLANGLMFAQKDRRVENIRGKEVAFLNLTRLLVSLEKSVPVTDNVDLEDVEFKHILRLVDNLSYLCKSDAVTEKAKEACQKTLLQRLYACCRREDYDMAREIFEEESENLDKETSRKVQAILNADKKPHRFLAETTVTEYITTMTRYLDTVYQTFPAKPTLTMFADAFVGKKSPYKRAKTSYSLKEIDGSLDSTEGLEEASTGGEEALSKKLARIREQKRKAAAVSVANANHNHSNTDEDQQEPDSQGKPSPEKQRRVKDDGRNRSKRDNEAAGTSSTHQQDLDADAEASDIEFEASSDEEEDLSLQKRVPFKATDFQKRRSLALSSRNARRRPGGRKKWTEREEHDFYKAVQRHGVGRWAQIRSELRTQRTNVHLKDKWRTIANTNYDKLCQMYGPVENE